MKVEYAQQLVNIYSDPNLGLFFVK